MSTLNKIGRTATTVASDGNGNTVLTYHATRVVVWNAEIITLDSGGWLTNTTKQRMNQAATVYNLGFMVYQIKGDWVVKFGGRQLPFSDGMILDRVTGKAYANAEMKMGGWHLLSDSEVAENYS